MKRVLLRINDLCAIVFPIYWGHYLFGVWGIFYGIIFAVVSMELITRLIERFKNGQ